MRRLFELAVFAVLVALPVQAIAEAPAQGPQSAKAPNCLKSYPAAAMKAGIEGTTMLAFTVTEQGTVSDVKVVQSSGNADLDDAAATCAGRWHYKPATRDGKPVAVSWQATVQWKLH